jgi:hypothetical protein
MICDITSEQVLGNSYLGSELGEASEGFKKGAFNLSHEARIVTPEERRKSRFVLVDRSKLFSA